MNRPGMPAKDISVFGSNAGAAGGQGENAYRTTEHGQPSFQGGPDGPGVLSQAVPAGIKAGTDRPQIVRALLNGLAIGRAIGWFGRIETGLAHGPAMARVKILVLLLLTLSLAGIDKHPPARPLAGRRRRRTSFDRRRIVVTRGGRRGIIIIGWAIIIRRWGIIIPGRVIISWPQAPPRTPPITKPGQNPPCP